MSGIDAGDHEARRDALPQTLPELAVRLQVHAGLPLHARLGALLVHVVAVASTLPGLGEGLAARAAAAPLLR